MHHNRTKVRLSIEEFNLVNNAQILLTKNAIIKKVYEMFGLLAKDFQQAVAAKSNLQLLDKMPKISRGENYEGLPYVMLDYPRQFSKENTFAIRTFFWWGNFFSITLQVSGAHFQNMKPDLLHAIKQNKLQVWFVGIHDSDWHHHFEQDNYRLMDDLELVEYIQLSTKIKLAKKIPLTEWDDVLGFLESNFKYLLDVIGISYQYDEKDL